MSRRKILITGGAGFIGSHLVQSLFEKNDIVVLDNLNPQIHGEDSYTYKTIKDKCLFIKGDVQNIEDWEMALNTGVDSIIHLAAETGTGQSMYESTRYEAVNCRGTALLADILSSKKYNITKVILASSRSIYGEGKYISESKELFYPNNRQEQDMANGLFECLHPLNKTPLMALPTDESSWINPLSVYGLTKYFQENILYTICFSLGIDYVALRFQNVYGPGQSLSNPYTGIISIFSNRIRQNKDVYIFEDGKESRDFVYIDDVVNAVKLSLGNNINGVNVYNVGSGEKTSVLDIAENLAKLINPKTNITITGQFRKGDIRHNFADLRNIKRDLGFDPKVDITQGLTLFVEWMLNQEVGNDGYERSLEELNKKGLLTGNKQ
ncbi:MAG: NAD-dependent epimerase/dehydratase family protein [Chitinophagales bacterium]